MSTEQRPRLRSKERDEVAIDPRSHRALARVIRKARRRKGDPGDHLRRVPGPLRLLLNVPRHTRGRPSQGKYDNKVRDLVLGRILGDGMSIERTLRSLRREFLLGLSSGFDYD